MSGFKSYTEAPEGLIKSLTTPLWEWMQKQDESSVGQEGSRLHEGIHHALIEYTLNAYGYTMRI